MIIIVNGVVAGCRSDGFRTLLDEGANIISAKGYWNTLNEFSRRHGSSRENALDLESGISPSELWPHPFYDCNMGMWLFGPKHGIYSYNK